MPFLRRFFAGGGTSTVLSSSMSSTDTTFTIGSSSGWPGAPGVNFLVVVDRGNGASEEKIWCASNSGSIVSVAAAGRGADGTNPTSHNANATVSLIAGAIDFDEANQVAHLMGNMAEGAIPYGKGAGVLAQSLPIGPAGSVLASNGTDPIWENLISTVYPVGAVFLSAVATNPATLLGFGTWAAIGQGRVLMGVGVGSDIHSNNFTVGFGSGGDVVGEYSHTLVAAESGARDHAHLPNGGAGNWFVSTFNSGTAYTGVASGSGGNWANGSTGAMQGGALGATNAHNITEPYFGVYVWQRTA